MLYTARSEEFPHRRLGSSAQRQPASLGLDGIVGVGGDGTFRGLQEFSKQGISVVGVPATIDNDIVCTDYTIGYDTAANTAVRQSTVCAIPCSPRALLGRRGHGQKRRASGAVCRSGNGRNVRSGARKKLDFEHDVVDCIRGAPER